MASSLFCDWTWKEEVSSWWSCESVDSRIIMSKIDDGCCLDSCILIISKIDGFLFLIGGSEYESWKYCGQGGYGGQVGWKLDSGEAKPHELCEEWKWYENYGHKMGAWVIFIRIRPFWHTRLVKVMICRVGNIRKRGCVIWIKIGKIVVICHITQTQTKKKKTNK